MMGPVEQVAIVGVILSVFWKFGKFIRRKCIERRRRRNLSRVNQTPLYDG